MGYRRLATGASVGDAQDVEVDASAADRARLKAVVAKRNSAQKVSAGRGSYC
jgi:hypothetical protein